MLTSILAVPVLALASQVYIVDLNGGPGSDFTQIQAAIDAAADGDVLHIKPGLYQQFSLSKGLTLQAEPGAAARAVCRVQNLGEEQQVVIDGLAIVTLHVTANEGPVLLHGLSVVPDPQLIPTSSAEHLRVDDCHDVRMHKSSILSPGGARGMEAVFVYDARLEIAHCNLEGQRGAAEDSQAATDGGHALLLGPNARVQLVDSILRAGDGGTATPGSNLAAGNGGDGVRIEPGSECIASASGNERIWGGGAGSADTCATAGLAGDAVELELGALARVSGFQLFPGFTPCSGHEGLPLNDPGSGAVLPALIDPVLLGQWSGVGTQATYLVNAPPNATAWLYLGRKPKVIDSAGSIIEELCTRERIIFLGATGAGGFLERTVTLPSFLPKGFAVMAQVEFTDVNTLAVSRSNSSFVIFP